MKARFHRLARLELKSAVEYYNREEPGLGDIFGRIVREATSELRAEPQRWPVFEGRIRRYFLKKFRSALCRIPRLDTSRSRNAFEPKARILER